MKITVATISVLVSLVALFIAPTQRGSYMFGHTESLVAAVIIMALGLLLKIIKKNKAADCLYIIGAFCMAYGLMEVFWQFVRIEIGIRGTGHAANAFLEELDGYILNRSYQYLAIISLWVSLRYYFRNQTDFFVKKGDINVKTDLLSSEEPTTWKNACIRICLMIIVLSVAATFLRGTENVNNVTIATLAARLIGGFNNSLIEEIVFRGLLLSSFMLILSPKLSNWLQAILFSIIHVGYISFSHPALLVEELIKLALYVAIGWFLGKSAIDTKGIFIATLLHFLITGAIWLTISFA